MLHAFFRAATLALLAAVAVLVYVNYFRTSDPQSDAAAELAAVETPPDLPKLAPIPETQPAAPAQPAISTGALAGTAAENSIVPSLTVRASRERAELAANSSSVVLAEVVELPPSSRRHAGADAGSNQQLAAPSASTVRRTHVVQSGESLWVISRKYFGSAEHIAKIAVANGLTSHDRIRAGQVLVIPDLNAQPSAALAAARTAPKHNLEDEADHEDAPRATPVVLGHGGSQPATMNAQSAKRY